MTFHSKCVAGVIALVSLLAVSGSSHSEPLGHMAYLTFNQPVALPGVSLAPGTYIFELASPLDDHSLVRVSSRDRRHVYLTAFTNAVERPRNLRDDQVIVFGEAPATAPRPIAIWYPYGISTGREFIYRH